MIADAADAFKLVLTRPERAQARFFCPWAGTRPLASLCRIWMGARFLYGPTGASNLAQGGGRQWAPSPSYRCGIVNADIGSKG